LPPVILLSPDGQPFTQAIAQELAALPRILLVCGHYEGLDERVRDGLLEYPHYTRPAVWEDLPVPPVLLSGHHGEVAKWRRRERLRRTLARRPDLLARAYADGLLSHADLVVLADLGWMP
jgi:tRNA (guanine37-N1)-methyltransferase